MMKIDNGVYTLNTSFTTKKQADLIKNLVKKEISTTTVSHMEGYTYL